MYTAMLLSAMVVAACGVSRPQRPPGELFRGVELPPEGTSRVYIFRPGFSRVSEGDSPTLIIDEKEVARLSVESYTEVIVKPGSYTISLKPNAFESQVWAGTWRLNAEGAQIYFLAVWNDIEHYSSFTLAPMAGGAFLLLPASGVRNTALRFELVSKDDALPVISQQTYLPPLFKALEPTQ